MSTELSHLDEKGQARMVDIGDKPDTTRIAIAKGEIVMRAETLVLIESDSITKGDVLGVSRLAGVMGAKRTAELIPLCHPLPLNQVTVDFEIDHHLPGVIITTSAKTVGKTGVEMEALTAVTIAALTIYDMAKAVEKTMRIQNIRLIEKHGGRSGAVINE
jgi:cyclic pyranopterin phosphate synthase